MSPLSRPLTLLGLLLLSHACYSAYEYHSLTKTPLTTLASRLPTTDDGSSLPLDITLETLISVVLICTGLVLGSEELKPISWRVWAGKVEKEGMGGPFAGLEDRWGFVDVRAKRKEFADWVRGQEEGGKGQ